MLGETCKEKISVFSCMTNNIRNAAIWGFGVLVCFSQFGLELLEHLCLSCSIVRKLPNLFSEITWLELKIRPQMESCVPESFAEKPFFERRFESFAFHLGRITITQPVRMFAFVFSCAFVQAFFCGTD
jgi:hypothetical protein